MIVKLRFNIKLALLKNTTVLDFLKTDFFPNIQNNDNYNFKLETFYVKSL